MANKLKTIDIKGKAYVLVVDRVRAFNEGYLNGSITTELVSEPNSERVVIKATVIPDVKNMDRKFTGYSQALIGDGYINKTSALENGETSAVGRALALMGIGITDSFASADEIVKATSASPVFKPFKAMTPDEYESLPEIQKDELQVQKKENNRAIYGENKKIGFLKRKECPNCSEWMPINATKHSCEDQVVGVGDERGSKFGDK